MKKILSLTLALCVLFGAVSIISASAQNTSEYVYRVLEDGTAEVLRTRSVAQKLVIPSEIDGHTVTSIGEYAFDYNDSVTEVILPDTIKKINRCAFDNCENLTKINLPESLTYIGDYAFNSCKKLESVTLSDKLTYIGNSAFTFCYQLGYNGLPKSLEYIGANAFDDCKNITNAIVPEGVTYLGDNAFRWCENLSEVSLPKTLEYIGSNPFFKTPYSNNTDNWENGAFYYGEYLLDVDPELTGDFHVKDGTRIIAAEAFTFSDLSLVTMPDSVECIGDYCFSIADRMKEVKLSKNLKEIPHCAFRDCSNLTSITIPESVTIIREDAFWDCRSLSYIKIPESVETMETRAVGYNTLYKFENDVVYDAGKEKSEILTIAGYKGSAAENYAAEFGFDFKPLSHKYQNQIFELFDITEENFGVSKEYIAYHEGYEHYSEADANEAATPDYALIELYKNPEYNKSEAQIFGDYIVRTSRSYFPETLGYYIYLPESNEIFTLAEAFEKDIENIYNVFTEGEIGELLGDVNYDRKLNIRDATLIQKDIARISYIDNNYIPSDFTWHDTDKLPEYIGDFNRDGKMNIRDATAIQKYIAGPDKNR